MRLRAAIAHPAKTPGRGAGQAPRPAPSAPSLQAKLRLGPQDDPLERQADRAADAVVAGRAAPPLAPAPGPQRKCAECVAEEEDEIRLQAEPGGTRSAGAEAAAGSVAGPGAPLAPTLRAYFEPRFGTDLSAVRIHDGGRAAAAARAIGARAFTLGRDIGFAAGAYAPETREGRHLLAHELAHVTQQRAALEAPTIRRQPGGGGEPTPGEPKRPADKVVFEAKDLLVYPLIVDLWKDIVQKKLTAKERKEFQRKGKEGAALWNLVMGIPFGGAALESDASFGDFLESWLDHAEEIHRIAGGSDLYLDFFSAFVDIQLESYLASDLFKSRLKSHAASLVTVIAVAQGILSTVEALKEPGAEVGEIEPSQWEKQFGLVTTLFNLLLKEQIKAPDFFQVGPLKLATHPAFAAGAFAGGEPPSELTFEHGEGLGEGQGGEQLKLGLTLNLPQVVGLFQEGGPSATDLANLQKYRGWQGSAWFSYERSDPTALQKQAGKLPFEAFKTGALFGGRGFLGQLEGGARYSGDEARALTSWFVHGGFGYSGKKGDVIQKMGFNAIYTDWTAQDILAPGLGAGGAPVAGGAFRFTPFTKLEFGERHKFSVGAALGFVTGSHEKFNVSDFRGDFAYTYMGDRSEDQLPVFKIDLSGSVGRLDWFNPDSPLMTGIQARTSFSQYFLAGAVHTGAGEIPTERAAQIGKVEKVQVPTTLLFTGGVQF